MIRCQFSTLSLSAIMLFALQGCSEDTPGPVKPVEQPVQVILSSHIKNNGYSDTRATYPSTDATGAMLSDLVKLKSTGFGVYAIHHTANSDETSHQYDYDGETGKTEFNFMHNQLVSWNDELDGNYITKWEYTPIKYWPNDNDPADDQNNDTSNDPATSDTKRHYVSFFAYAPWTERKDSSSTGNDGIINSTTSNTESANSYLRYRLPETPRMNNTVDLLWSRQTNLYKTDDQGSGTTSGTVDFQFIHALSKVTIKIRGLFDRINTTLDWPEEYAETLNPNTRILIDTVVINTQLKNQGNMYFAPQPNESNVPYWTGFVGDETMLKCGSNDIMNDTLRMPTELADCNTEKRLEKLKKYLDAETADEAAEIFGTLNIGVTHLENHLFNYEEENTPPYFLLLPQEQKEKMTVHIVYHVITYDAKLVRNTPKYFSIVTNDLTATLPATFTVQPNKSYTLRILLGMTSVKFDVVGVEDWAQPIMLDAIVREYEDKTSRDYTIEP